MIHWGNSLDPRISTHAVRQVIRANQLWRCLSDYRKPIKEEYRRRSGIEKGEREDREERVEKRRNKQSLNSNSHFCKAPSQNAIPFWFSVILQWLNFPRGENKSLGTQSDWQRPCETWLHSGSLFLLLIHSLLGARMWGCVRVGVVFASVLEIPSGQDLGDV